MMKNSNYPGIGRPVRGAAPGEPGEDARTGSGGTGQGRREAHPLEPPPGRGHRGETQGAGPLALHHPWGCVQPSRPHRGPETSSTT